MNSKCRIASRFCSLVLLALPVAATTASVARDAVPDRAVTTFAGEQAEEFLRTARVIEIEPIPVGVTRPRRVVLSDGKVIARGIWKTVNIYAPVYRFSDGGVELGFRDSYKHEIAAYELDKLLGLAMVPPTVERRLRRERGSLQLWVENAMSETERRKRGVRLPDAERWNEQIYTLRLIRQLLDDSDFNNISNLLLDADFRVWAIDHSRGFRLGKKLRRPASLEKFSRAALDGLRGLDADLAEERLRPWLSREQIRTLLLRRDLIVEHAEQLVAERGEMAVLYP